MRSALSPVPILALLALLLTFQPAIPRTTGCAWAGRSEQTMRTITTTTIYGAVLGGMLGLASALVVRDGYEDDAVRWGVTLGSFSGFAFGIADARSSPDGGSEEVIEEQSLRIPRSGREETAFARTAARPSACSVACGLGAAARLRRGPTAAAGAEGFALARPAGLAVKNLDRPSTE